MSGPGAWGRLIALLALVVAVVTGRALLARRPPRRTSPQPLGRRWSEVRPPAPEAPPPPDPSLSAAARRGPRAFLAALGRRVGAAVGHAHRTSVVRGRWVVLVAWALIGLFVFTALPVGRALGGDAGFSNLLPADSPALQVEERALQSFRVPVLSGTTIVAHAPDGLSLNTRAVLAGQAYKTTRPSVLDGPATEPGSIIAAVPVPFVSADTAVTYLFLSPGTSIWQTMTLARQYKREVVQGLAQPGVDVSITGFVPAQVAQGEQLAAALPRFELASLLVITLIVGFTFRSLLAPLMVLVSGGAGYLIFYRVLSGTAGQFGLSVPQQLEPVLAALFIGVITDYCVLLFSSFRMYVEQGMDRFAAADAALRDDGPVIGIAGVTVAGGIIALLVSPFEFFRSLGPSLAVTVVAAVLVALTLAPALMTLVGTRMFSLRGSAAVVRRAERHRAKRAGRVGLFGRGLRVITTKPGAGGALVVAVIVLTLAALPVLHARLSLSFTSGLPEGDPVQVSARVLDRAGIRGITAPVEVLVEGDGVAETQRVQLVALQLALQLQPGVARVLGPAENPLRANLGVVYSADGNAARYIVVFDSDPLGANAVRDLRTLQRNLPQLVSAAGLKDVRVDVTGQTRIASEVASLTNESLRDTLIAAVLIEFLILALYLRSLLTPLVVLLAGLLSMGSALGLTVLLFQDVLRQPGLTFYAPFSTAVLLLALGADYTVFTVGAIWRRARQLPLRESILETLPGTARAVTAAGVILASTFAAVGIVPLTAFQQIAFTMAVGLLIDTLIVRPVMTPAMLTLLGRAALWPRRPAGAPARAAAAPPPAHAERPLSRT
ncbi:MMPL family transporter [Amnibacterium endophyticum]|uniref:MMPL family transporter n=1 Tax=Amnibacterium endophyticum TaxID=2109337 RepID=A0ABW4LEJ7_9MICO